MFKLEFSTDNAAFDNYGATEIVPLRQYLTARILRTIAKRIEEGNLDGKVMDLNGNSIGHYELNGD